jgi:hypothetical protein
VLRLVLIDPLGRFASVCLRPAFAPCYLKVLFSHLRSFRVLTRQVYWQYLVETNIKSRILRLPQLLGLFPPVSVLPGGKENQPKSTFPLEPLFPLWLLAIHLHSSSPPLSFSSVVGLGGPVSAEIAAVGASSEENISFFHRHIPAFVPASKLLSHHLTNPRSTT